MIICTIIICITVYSCIWRLTDIWDDEKRREHDRWWDEHGKKEEE